MTSLVTRNLSLNTQFSPEKKPFAGAVGPASFLSKEQIEFRQAEFELFMCCYSLECFENVLGWVIRTIREMISRGEIPATEAGVMKAMSHIKEEIPRQEMLSKYLLKRS